MNIFAGPLKRWTWLFWSVVFCWMVLYNIRPIQDPDLWWHLASGRYMVQHLSVPRVDVFSLTARGSAWVNTYWLQEILAYFIYLFGGLKGIILAKSLFVAGLLLMVGRYHREHPRPTGVAFLGVVWMFLAAHPRGFGWEEKASYVSLGLMAFLYHTLYFRRGEAQRRLFTYWPVSFLLWANMHRGFMLGLIVLGIYVCAEGLKKGAPRLKLMLYGTICVLATLCTPYGWQVYGMGWQDFTLSPAHVLGWAQTPFRHLELYWLTLILFWTAMGWTLWKKRSWGGAFIVTSLLLSVLSARFASLYPYFILWAVPWLLRLISEESDLLGRPQVVGVLLIIPLLSCLSVRPRFGINTNTFPVDAVQFLKDNRLRTPLYHDYEQGGFFLWSLEGEPPVLIDGRYPAVEGYRSLFPEMLRATQGPPLDFQRFLTHRNISCAVVKYPAQQQLPSTFRYYFPIQDWALIYWDDVVLCFVRRLPQFQRVLRQYEFAHLDPDADLRYWVQTVWRSAPPSKKSLIRKELERNARAHPGSRRTRRWLEVVSGLV